MLNEDQFHEWFHGTSKENAASIKKTGLTALHYNPEHYVLTTDRDIAEEHAAISHEGNIHVLKVRIPNSRMYEFTESAFNPSRFSGIVKRIPPEMISDA